MATKINHSSSNTFIRVLPLWTGWREGGEQVGMRSRASETQLGGSVAEGHRVQEFKTYIIRAL